MFLKSTPTCQHIHSTSTCFFWLFIHISNILYTNFEMHIFYHLVYTHMYIYIQCYIHTSFLLQHTCNYVYVLIQVYMRFAYLRYPSASLHAVRFNGSMDPAAVRCTTPCLWSECPWWTSFVRSGPLRRCRRGHIICQEEQDLSSKISKKLGVNHIYFRGASRRT